MTTSIAVPPSGTNTSLFGYEYHTASLAAILKEYPGSPSHKPPRLSEEQVRRVAEILAQADKKAWSRVPRIYAVLHIIDRVDTIETFIREQITDLWFPFSIRTLPEGFRSPSDRYAFIEVQDFVLTKALDLEREDGRHRHFATSTEIPLIKREELGKGGNGSVDRVLSTITYREYARKLIRKGKTFRGNATTLRYFEAELAHLKKLKHIHIVQFVGSYTDPKYVGILMTPVADTNLKDFLARDVLTTGERSLLRTFYGCLAIAVQYLHDQQVRHKDIKPQNILVKGDQVLLTDFGLAFDWSEVGQSTTTGHSEGKTARYCAPEVAKNLRRNTQADLWSLGCVFLEIWTVLKGETVINLLQHLADFGDGSTCYHENQDAITSWYDALLGKRRATYEDQPLPWIKGTLQNDQNERWTARSLVTNLIDVNEADDNPVLFIGTCCSHLDDDSTVSDVSSKRSSRALDNTTVSDIAIYQPNLTPIQHLKHDGSHTATTSNVSQEDVEQSSQLAPTCTPQQHKTNTSTTSLPAQRGSESIAETTHQSLNDSDLLSQTILPNDLIRSRSEADNALESNSPAATSENQYDRRLLPLAEQSNQRQQSTDTSNQNSIYINQSNIKSADNVSKNHHPLDVQHEESNSIRRTQSTGHIPELTVRKAKSADSLEVNVSDTESLSERMPSAQLEQSGDPPRVRHFTIDFAKQAAAQLEQSDDHLRVQDFDFYSAQHAGKVPTVQATTEDLSLAAVTEKHGEVEPPKTHEARETSEPRQVGRSPGHTTSNSRVASPNAEIDGKKMVIHRQSSMLPASTTVKWQRSKTILDENYAMFTVTFSPDGKLLATCGVNKVLLWHLAQDRCWKTLSRGSNFINSVAFSPDGRMLASSSGDHPILLWKLENSQVHLELTGLSMWINSVAYSPDGKLIASGTADHTIRVWNAATGEIRSTLTEHSRRVSSVAFSPNDSLLASGSDDKTIRLWDLTTNNTRFTLSGHTSGVNWVAFSPGGGTLASGSDDRTVRLWAVKSGELIDTLYGHTDWVTSVAYSPNGLLLASGSKDTTIRLWGVRTKETWVTLTGHSSLVRSVAFSPDGKLLASCSEDRTVRLWGGVEEPTQEQVTEKPKGLRGKLRKILG